MLSFGWSEIALTAIVVIIIVGPKEIPNLLKQVSNFSKSLRKISRQFKSSLNDLAEEADIKDIKKSISEISKIKQDIDPSNELKEEIKSIQDTIQFTDKEMAEINSKIKKD